MVYLSGYSKYKVLTLTGGASGALTDHQLKLAVSYEAAMQGDFDDLRFTQADGVTLVDAWAELIVTDTSATVWVEFPTTPANTVEQIYRMYYGNAGASNYWDIDATMIFGDDFPGSSIDGGKWSDNGYGTAVVSGGKLTYTGSVLHWGMLTSISEYSRPMVLHQKSRFQGRTTAKGAAIGFRTDDSADWIQGLHFTTTMNQIRNRAASSDSNANSNFGTGEKIYKTVWDAATVTWEQDGVAMTGSPLNTNIPSGDMPVRFETIGGSGYGIECDWIFLTKYAANPPTYEFGAEQSVPTGNPYWYYNLLKRRN